MNAKSYRLLFVLASLLGLGAIAIVFLTTGAAQTVASTVAGSAIGLAASIWIQDLASQEQTDMIKSVTLDAEGITTLPETFQNIKWLAFATKKAISRTSKQVEWHFVDLTKIGGAGPRFVSYSLVVKNLFDAPVTYHATFIGSQGCVICAITREHETTSTATFDSTVSAAGIYFGVGYLTDWACERDVTLMICGTSQLSSPTIDALPPRALAAFHRWYEKVDFDINSAYKLFPTVEASSHELDSNIGQHPKNGA
jgi:hypothetical protein